MKKERKEKDFVKTPVFKGGIKAMKEFVQQNLRYPKEALENKIEGSVHLRYTVNNKGKVIRAKVVSGIGYGCDEEAIRLVKLFNFYITKGGKSKREYHKTVSIHFRLPKAAKANPVKNMQINYSVTTTSTPAEEQGKNNNTYSYTLKL